MPSPGYHISGKEVEVRDSGSWHHQLCGCCNLQLIQNHGAPSHGPLVRVLSPLFFPAKSLLLPKPRGKKKHSKTTWSSPFPLEPRGPPYSLQNRRVLPIHSRTAWSSSFPSEPHGPLFTSPKLPDPLPSPPKPCDPLFPFIRTAWTSTYFRTT